MRIVFFTNVIPDPCGAFFHDIGIAKEMQRRGHTVTFVPVHKGTGPLRGTYRTFQYVYYTNAEKELAGADLWSAPHFPVMPLVRRLNERFQKPLLVTMHFGESTDSVRPYTRYGNWAELLWIVSRHNYNYVINNIPLSPTFKGHESIRPLMIESEVKFNERGTLPTGDCITMINANLLKGLPIFVEIAKKFPERKFLAVRPYYNKIAVPEDMPNIEWVDFQEDIRSVLRRTRVLLVPSMYESWGRVAFEAMYNGIPVVFTKPFGKKVLDRPSGTTEGMYEWIRDSQFPCAYDLPRQDWIDAINKLDDPDVYAEYSKRAYDQTYDMNVFGDFQIMEKKLYDFSVQYKPVEVSNKTGTTSTLSSRPQSTLGLPTAAARGNAMPFRGGRFSLRR